MKEEFSWLLIGILAATLVAAAIGDWRSRIIPNRLNAAIALLALPHWWAIGVSAWPGVPMQLAVAACVFGVFALFFHFDWMGGGDVKMAGALALWLPAPAVLHMLVVMSLAGGALTLAMLIAHRIAKSAGNPEVPYGIAIAFAGLWIIGERFLNQFV